MTEKKLQQLVDNDIMKLTFLLKLRMASYKQIQKKEQQQLRHFHNALHSVRDIADHLRRELSLISRLRKNTKKDYKIKRWNLIHRTLQHELAQFHHHLRQGKHLVHASQHLHTRLTHFNKVLDSARRKTLKSDELRLIRSFIQRP